VSASQRTKGQHELESSMPGEVWAEIATCGGRFLGRYQVSNLGRVRAHPDASISGSKPGRVLFTARDNCGYPQAYLHYAPMKKQTVKVHRLVADAFLGQRAAGMQVNHIDGNKANNAVTNLEYVTSRENSRHAVRVLQTEKALRVFGRWMSCTEAVSLFGAPGVHAKMVRRRVGRLRWFPELALVISPMPAGRPFKVGA
jgi:HNH endonuclease/NUMOD4 motif